MRVQVGKTYRVVAGGISGVNYETRGELCEVLSEPHAFDDVDGVDTPVFWVVMKSGLFDDVEFEAIETELGDEVL
jgi:hypothetical protein